MPEEGLLFQLVVAVPETPTPDVVYLNSATPVPVVTVTPVPQLSVGAATGLVLQPLMEQVGFCTVIVPQDRLSSLAVNLQSAVMLLLVALLLELLAARLLELATLELLPAVLELELLAALELGLPAALELLFSLSELLFSPIELLESPPDALESSEEGESKFSIKFVRESCNFMLSGLIISPLPQAMMMATATKAAKMSGVIYIM